MDPLAHRVWFFLFIGTFIVGVSDRYFTHRERWRAQAAVESAQRHFETSLEQVGQVATDCRSALRQCNADLFTSQIDAQECRGDFIMLEASQADAGKSKK